MKAVLLLLGIGIVWICLLYAVLCLFIQLVNKEDKYIEKMNTEDKLKDLGKRYEIYRKGSDKK